MKTVLVTGGATGIGLAIATKLSNEGWNVYATAMPNQDTAELSAIVADKQILKVDLSDEKSTEQLINTIIQHNQLDALVSNAGLAIPGPVEAISPGDLKLQFDVNVLAPMQLSRGLLPLLRKSKGRIIFMGAGQGRVALPFGGPYGGSKAALAALTDALRAEVAEMGVTVSLIEPGAIKTGILASSKERSDVLLGKMPADLRKYYEKPLKKTLATSEKAFRSALPAERVARLVSNILSARKPKPRYLLGKEAVLLAFIALLTAKARSALVLKTIK